MKQRHTRTPAKVLIAKQLEHVRNTIQLLHAKHQMTLSTVPQSPDEEAALQAIVDSNSKLITLYIQEAERLRLTIKTWDERNHSQVTYEETAEEERTALELAEEKVQSLDQSINQRRSVLVELSETQRQLRKVLRTQSTEDQAQTQSTMSKNSVILSSLQETLGRLRSSYDRANDALFALQQA